MNNQQVLFFVDLLLSLIGMQNHTFNCNAYSLDIFRNFYVVVVRINQKISLIHEKFWLWVYSRPVLCMELFSIVFSHETFSNFNNTCPATMQNQLTLSCCESFPIHSCRCKRKFWCSGSLFCKRTFCLDFTQNNWLFHHLIRLSWSIVKGFLHTCLWLLRKDWHDLQKQFCEKVSIVASSTVFRVFCFWVYPWTMLWCGKLDTRFLRILSVSFPWCDPKFLVDFSLSHGKSLLLGTWTIVSHQTFSHRW